MSSHISIHNVVEIEIGRQGRTTVESKWFEILVTDNKGVVTEISLFFRNGQMPVVKGLMVAHVEEDA